MVLKRVSISIQMAAVLRVTNLENSQLREWVAKVFDFIELFHDQVNTACIC